MISMAKLIFEFPSVDQHFDLIEQARGFIHKTRAWKTGKKNFAKENTRRKLQTD